MYFFVPIEIINWLVFFYIKRTVILQVSFRNIYSFLVFNLNLLIVLNILHEERFGWYETNTGSSKGKIVLFLYTFFNFCRFNLYSNLTCLIYNRTVQLSTFLTYFMFFNILTNWCNIIGIKQFDLIRDSWWCNLKLSNFCKYNFYNIYPSIASIKFLTFLR